MIRRVLACSAAAALFAGCVSAPMGGEEAPAPHVVLVAGDEEYRSEEALPMLARILEETHGFRTTVLFSTDPETGFIDPENQTHIPGFEHVAEADLVVLFVRFRELPDEQMKLFVDHVRSGGPVLGIRTATHAFSYTRDPESPYADWSWNSSDWPGGFGRQVLGETWVAHHGAHGSQSTRGVPVAPDHPVLTGVEDVWGPTDVYAVRDLPADATVLMEGAVLDGMQPTSRPVEGSLNDPRMPIVWVREDVPDGPRRLLCSTIGAATDFRSEDLRRMFVNACFWLLGREEDIPARADVRPILDYEPSDFGFGGYVRGVLPVDDP